MPPQVSAAVVANTSIGSAAGPQGSQSQHQVHLNTIDTPQAQLNLAHATNTPQVPRMATASHPPGGSSRKVTNTPEQVLNHNDRKTAKSSHRRRNHDAAWESHIIKYNTEKTAEKKSQVKLGREEAEKEDLTGRLLAKRALAADGAEFGDTRQFIHHIKSLYYHKKDEFDEKYEKVTAQLRKMDRVKVKKPDHNTKYAELTAKLGEMGKASEKAMEVMEADEAEKAAEVEKVEEVKKVPEGALERLRFYQESGMFELKPPVAGGNAAI